MLAVKRLFSPHASEFENETEMLIALTNEGHKNLVQLLATYKYKGKYHLLFPYAKFNLRKLWAEIPEPQRNAETYGWALDQMTGLASGLVAIHQYQSNMAYNTDIGNPGMTRFRQSVRRNLAVEPGEAKFGRHGDLKPENILWFGEFRTAGPSGVLQITDFGLGHFHRLESRSRQDPSKIKGSETYTPPEIPLNQLVSRAYDIWSLGCVFLEFATWLLEGTVGLEDFGAKRLEIAPDRIEDDTFFSISTGGAVMRGGVRDWIEHLHKSPHCSDMVHELLNLVREKLLVVRAESRINSGNLYFELKAMIQKAKTSSEYLAAQKR
jgi:serine/threonine protein kinase